MSKEKVMALVGNIEQFNETGGEDFNSYLERLEHLFIVNKVDENMKISLFITLAGPMVYQTLKNLVAPKKPTELTYAEIKSKLILHYAPPVSEIYERFVFYNCQQKVNQSVSDYMVELKKLSSTCNFGQFLEDALRDRFVCGMMDEGIQKKLLAEAGLTFANACQIAQASELAQKQVRSLADTSSNVNSLKKSGFQQSSSDKVKCPKCGRKHEKGDCPASRWKCYGCSKVGHVKRLCPNKKNSSTIGVVEESESDSVFQCNELNEDLWKLNMLKDEASGAPHKLKLLLNGELYIDFEVDTGACKSVISADGYKIMFGNQVKLSPVSYKLNVVSGQGIKAIGECNVKVELDNNNFILPLTVIESPKQFTPLLGRNWLNVLFPGWQQKFSSGFVNFLQGSNTVSELKLKFPVVFDNNLCNPIKKFKINFSIKKDATPIFRKPYSMPYALKHKVEEKLGQMIKVGILKPVSFSEWASPIVIVPKKCGNDVRICVDFRVTVNKVLNVNQYPLPIPADIFASLAGGKIFCVLDMSGAYQQLQVHSDSQKYLTINTHMGMFRYTRLTYGIACAPALFQSVIDQILCGIQGVSVYLDDVLIAGSSLEHAKEILGKVLSKLSEFNVKLNVDKCRFFENQVEYLGHLIDKDGIHPTKEKLRAIVDAPEPRDLTQLRSYLGLINFYSKFVPMLSSQLRPLYKLLERGQEFSLNKECIEAFEKSKRLICENDVLAHYDTNKTIVIACDASAYGVGGVLSHRESNGQEKPIFFVSGSLSKAEKNYSQLEREALAIIFCVKKFHKFIYGRSFILVSDHQPLKILFNPDRNISVLSASRITRWNVILSAYSYTIEYRKGSKMYEADMLSRLPLSDVTGIDSSINSFNLTEDLPISYEDVAKVSSKDGILLQVMDFVKTGWPNKCGDGELKPYFLKRNELSIESQCLMVGIRVVIPTVLRESILELIHEGHIGIVRSKMLARAVVWWPGLQQDIETMINSCQVCQITQNNSEKALVSWPKTENVFERIHVDFFYKNNCTFLIIVDSKSKWVDIHVMKKGTSVLHTLDKLKVTFSLMGLPVMLVSDNGPPFNATEFTRFCQNNGITILKSPPYHPQSNGCAERHVQTVKAALEKCSIQQSELTMEQQVVNFLFKYRNTPSASTGLSPNEIVFKVKPRTRIDLLKPRKEGKVMFNKNVDYVKPDVFTTGEKVLVGKLGPYVQDKWVEGVIVRCVSATTYFVKVDDKIMYKHVNNLRKLTNTRVNLDVEKCTELLPVSHANVGNDMVPIAKIPNSDEQDKGNLIQVKSPSIQTEAHPSSSLSQAVSGDCAVNSPGTETSLRRSSRIGKKRVRLDL
ncbi:uncharacterized protein K02A2.6-like isoform X1 [Diabrotica virgifera virgifera]|uniref:RNA-directed DNA polymerase n=1 Tax=Diabrotica virgifera virgifera TaxID=50390 RepID=A0ABM5KHL0_DIAVI|nr:uncharacterized protein K02A2.6-like isoform X1 [Diabrotica virgifera virgifera]